MRRLPIAMVLAILVVGAARAEEVRVTGIPEEVRTNFELARFYQKYVDADGMPVVASGRVSDFALLEARYIVIAMIGQRPEVFAAIVRNRVRLAVMAPTELTTDIPEHSDLTPKDYWDRRARGLGATEARPVVSCAEENLLGYPGDPYPAENILVHEFGHVIHERGMNSLDGTFDSRLREAYAAATRAGLWRGTYAGSNASEYWAIGTQCWFDCSRTNDADHNAVGTRADIRKYDPQLAALLAEVYGDGAWRYVRPARRATPSPHLAGFDVSKAGAFAWPARLLPPADSNRQSPVAGAPTSGDLLPPLVPASRATWRSTGGQQGTKVTFKNQTDGPIQVDWMDYQGQPKIYFTIQPGEKVAAATFAGHLWRARDDRGTVLAYFLAGVQPGTAEIK